MQLIRSTTSLKSSTMQQRDLFTRRWRSAEPPDPSETAIQIALADRLRLMAPRDVVWWHTPNGGGRDRREAAKLKAMGLLPGVPDLTFIMPGGSFTPRVVFLELKAKGGRPMPAQLAFADRAIACRCHWEWADSLDRAVECLEQYGILPSGGR